MIDHCPVVMMIKWNADESENWEWKEREEKKKKFPYYELAHGCMINWNNFQTMLHEMQWVKEITQQIDVSSKKVMEYFDKQWGTSLAFKGMGDGIKGLIMESKVVQRSQLLN